jgi:hypothetical protein
MKKATITPEKRLEFLVQLAAGLLSNDLSSVRGQDWEEIVSHATSVLNLIIKQECEEVAQEN